MEVSAIKNHDAFQRLLKQLVEAQRCLNMQATLQQRAKFLESTIEDLAKHAGVPEAELKKLRANSKLEAENFSKVRKEAAAKAVATRKARLAALAGVGQAAVGTQVIATPAGQVVSHTPKTPAPTAPVPQQTTLIEVPASAVQKAAVKAVEQATKSAYRVALKDAQGKKSKK